MKAIRTAIIGLDTSHSIELPRRMIAPDCPRDQRVSGLLPVSCLRFETPFQDGAGLDGRQEQLEAWGINVTEDFDEVVADCDAIMLEINDPAYHLEFFTKAASLGKPVFVDKPLAGDLEDGNRILELAREHNVRVWSGSSLPFTPAVLKAAKAIPEASIGHTFGAMGDAPAGDSLVWYGVHTFEMLQRLMGPGAECVRAVESDLGVVSVIEYSGGRRGIVECIRGAWSYGGRAQLKGTVAPFMVNSKYLYRDLLRRIRPFFLGGDAPVTMETSFEGLAMMVAARQSVSSGNPESVASPQS